MRKSNEGDAGSIDTPRVVPDRVPLDVSHPHLNEFMHLLPALNSESERGRVLIACSYLDALLRDIINSALRETKESLQLLEGFNAPLGTLGSRATAAYAMGLITSNEFRECETLRKVRNKFAHNVHASFDLPDIKALCKNLTMSAKDYDNVVVDAKGQYTTAAVCLILNLTNRPTFVEKRPRISDEWPY